MKITEVRTRVVQWEGKTVALPPHFCTNPMDLVTFREASMGNFAFHGWVLVEIFTDAGLVGLGNAATEVVDFAERPPRQAGTIVKDEGDGGSKAAEFLAASKFI